MTKRLTYEQVLAERRKELFVGRDEEREAFRRNFTFEVPEHLIFAIYGQAGIGKSFLVARYQSIARENGALTALTNEAEAMAIRESSILQAMARLAKQLAEAGAPLKAFDERYKKYRECLQEVEADPDAPQGVFDLLGRTTARLAIGAAKMTPVGQAVGGFAKDVGVDEEALVEQAGAWTAYLAKKFKNKDEVTLVRDPVETLTPLFVEGLNKLAEERPVVLCFDTWERTEKHLDEWLRSLLDREGLSTGVWLVIAGRNRPGDEWEPFHPVMAAFELEEFTEEETRDYLKQQGITGEARVADILAFSGGVPVLVSTLASAKGGSATEAANSLVDRYLKWVDDPRQREAALHCAAARRLDKDIVAAVVEGDDADELFEWLTEMPFVQSRPGYWEYHPKVRKLMLRYARSRSVKDSGALHGKLEGYYQSLLAEQGEKAQYRDEVWRRHKLEAVYHGLMQESTKAVGDGLETFLLALRGYYPFAGEIAIMWLQAADEQEATNEVSRWARLLDVIWAAIESQSLKTALPFYEAARGRENLSDMARSEVYFIGGTAYYEMQDYGRAIEDYARAIELNPDYAAAYYNRGTAYARSQDYRRAIEDYGWAIGLNPEDATAYNNRGTAYAGLQDYRRAIEDYGRAIELNPEDAMAYNNRGLACYEMQDYGRAIEDCGRAIELNREDATAYNNRGNAYARLQDYGRAIEDYRRVIELNPDDARAYNNRGNAYARLQDYGRAIEDYGRAIELNPEDATAYYNLACAHALMGEVDDSCEWLEKAISLDAKYREMARGDEDFDGVRDNRRFRALVGENG
jgi:tetratricopeptide (TPR) repeat protein